MLRSEYRPSGPLRWCLNKFPPLKWSALGCIGSEQRSVGAIKELQLLGALESCNMLLIRDVESRFSQEADQKLAARRDECTRSVKNIKNINELGLFAGHADVVAIADELIGSSNGNILVDATSLPKRFFFPIIKRLLLHEPRDQISNLLITYTIPESYPPGSLAENFNDWAHLPLFSGDYSGRPSKMLVIGVGFQTLGLHEQLKGEPGLPTKLLLPFPAPPSSFQRSWELLRHLWKERNEELFQIYRTSAYEMGDTFDRLVTLTQGGRIRADLAPFGPKPMSLGMCIFATLTNSQVFYTQPSEYRPDYSIGIGQRDGFVDVRAYCIRLNGHDYFRL